MHKNVSSKAFQLLINGTEFNHTLYEFGSVGRNETNATNIVYEKLDGSSDFKMEVCSLVKGVLVLYFLNLDQRVIMKCPFPTKIDNDRFPKTI